MSLQKILILETNELTELTISSIKKNMPRVKYEVVPAGKSKVGTALSNCDGLTLVVNSGVVLNIKHGDLPPIERLNKYHICVSRTGVFVDHKRHAETYSVLESNIGKGHIDLSVFIINPDKWHEIPNTDKRILNEKKVLYMPRYLNHKTDILVPACIGAYEAVKYGIQGESAAIINYVPNIISGKATVSECYAYCFDKLEDYSSNLHPRWRDNISKLASRSKVKISKTRKRLHDLNA